MNAPFAQSAPSTLLQSSLIGTVGFGAASLAVFATVAFGERWMYSRLGLAGAYVVWTVLFVVLGGAALFRLVSRRFGWVKWYLLFSGAFALYSAGWVTSYFILRGRPGEWVGSLAGSVLMAVVFAGGFGVWKKVWVLGGLLFLANSCGYFLGEIPFKKMAPPVGMLLWGVIYGSFLEPVLA